jgi:hypothetical protein
VLSWRYIGPSLFPFLARIPKWGITGDRGRRGLLVPWANINSATGDKEGWS